MAQSSAASPFQLIVQHAHIQRGFEVTEDTRVEEIKEKLEDTFGWPPATTVLTTRPNKQVLQDGHRIGSYADIAERRQHCDRNVAGGDCLVDYSLKK